VLRARDVPYKDREAWAEDALLVIEVADSSLAYDRSTKRRLYAEARIPEYPPASSSSDPGGVSLHGLSWAPPFRP
jgi:hypothetical protein